jgi:chromosomal replication initiator protein
VIEFLARTINRNVRELVGGLNKLIAYAQLTGQPSRWRWPRTS